ncbi:head protein [Morganella phage vB_MmoP_MP2]|uniref:Capsid and scaffold protein n=1 Tax=Morganella phage vB_MmoP_MP2 TaxID=1852627 RepID=A0A192YC13_9CAUD|nr:head protein [Morganella phage vB_MmoP_MP2]ANM46391.1 hypothetical protein MP2_gp39 [Morganella phage vB_MmoP_MP2]
MSRTLGEDSTEPSPDVSQELTPQQKAAQTRARNKALKEAAESK